VIGGARRPSLPALLRARQALDAAGLDSSGELILAPHTSNEVWFVGDHVLRVAADSREGRLAIEADVVRLLPDAVPHARVVAHGRAALGEWLLMRRVPGRSLSDWWPALGPDHRREAVRQLAAALRALHAVRPSIELLANTHGDTPHPLPAARILELLAEARTLPGVRPAVLDAVERLVEKVGPSFDPREAVGGLVHGDVHFDNIFWDGERITALLDLEWVRPGPPDLDLDILLQYCEAPEVSTQAVDRFAVSAADLAPVRVWLREDYPELFSHPHLDDRLLLYRLGYDVRALLRDPPTPEMINLALHPYNRLRRAAAAG
jgi:aminoglycoside phosphotransferase (APT) family kinase protein